MSALAHVDRRARPEAPRRKGWCPGALTPMETGDGLIARVRAPRGRLSLDQAAALAESALACGNGAIGLSSRANLHLRGLSERTLPDLHARLRRTELIDAEPEVERLRNFVTSPLDGLDPKAHLDLGEAAAALEARLAEDASLRRLPAKFGFVLDAGGRLPLADVEADIRFEAVDADRFAVFLAGDDALAARCPAAATGEAAARLGRAFLRLAGQGERAPRRMRALVAREGAASVFAEAGLEAASRERASRRAALVDVLGAHAYGEAVVVGAAAAFGEIDAARFGALIEEARALGATELRLTPWRAFLLAGLAPRRADAMLETIVRLGFIADVGDLRLRVAACPGGPACIHGEREVRIDAARWARLLPKGEGVVLHVSGCAKGCARPAATSGTLVATASGYDLILGGRAGDPATRRCLSGADVERFLAAEGAALFGSRP